MKFVDTNVVVYAAGLHPEAPKRTAIARDILTHDDIVLSVQVLNEFFDRAVRKSAPVRLEEAEALAFLATLQELTAVPITRATHLRALDVRAQTKYRLYDCLIVASAQENDCEILLTQDMQHGRQVGSVKISNPFA